jgi:hypothetical protein
MKKLLSVMFCGLLMVASTAHADEPSKEVTEPSVQLANIGIPVFTGHTVNNYLFVSIKIHLTAKAPEAKFRDMEPYFRDAAVRAASKTSFNDPKHSDKLDLPRFQAAMMTAFSQVTGPGMIKQIEVVSQNAEHPAH